MPTKALDHVVAGRILLMALMAAEFNESVDHITNKGSSSILDYAGSFQTAM